MTVEQAGKTLPSVLTVRPSVHPSIRLASRVGRIFIGLLRRRPPSVPLLPLSQHLFLKQESQFPFPFSPLAGEWVRPTSPFLPSPVPHTRTGGTRETEDTKLI